MSHDSSQQVEKPSERAMKASDELHPQIQPPRGITPNPDALQDYADAQHERLLWVANDAAIIDRHFPGHDALLEACQDEYLWELLDNAASMQTYSYAHGAIAKLASALALAKGQSNE